MTGSPFSADDALAWGLVNRIVAQAELLPAVLETAARIQTASPLAVRQVKQALHATLGNDLVGGYRRRAPERQPLRPAVPDQPGLNSQLRPII